MNLIRYLPIVAFLLLAVMGFKACDSPIEKTLNIPGGAVLTTNAGSQATIQQAKVVYGKSKLSAEQLEDVDNGLLLAEGNAAKSGYTDERSKPLSFFTIQTPPYVCPLSPEQKIPSFLLHADAYDGSDFDQWNPKGKGVRDGRGVVYAAEMVLSLGTPGSRPENGWMYVCISNDREINKQAVNNGAEHILIANNDPPYFYETQYHFTRGHPLLPNIKPVVNSASGPNASNDPPLIAPASDVSFEVLNTFGIPVDIVRPKFGYVLEVVR